MEYSAGRLDAAVIAPWRATVRRILPRGIARHYRWLRYYAIKTRLGREAIRNIVIDWKYGGYCGGRTLTRFPETGAHTTVSTDYYELEKVFGHQGVSVRSNDVLVDLGCGKGRILNYWLHR